MKHLARISRMPARAQTSEGLCTEIDTDFQGRLCFLVTLLTEFLLPLAVVKNGGSNPETET